MSLGVRGVCATGFAAPEGRLVVRPEGSQHKVGGQSVPCRRVWNKDCVAESVEKLKRTYMDRIRNVMASVVLMCAAGAFMSAYAQEQPKLLQQTPPQPLQQTPDRTPPQAGSGYEIGALVRDDLGPVVGATVMEEIGRASCRERV